MQQVFQLQTDGEIPCKEERKVGTRGSQRKGKTTYAVHSVRKHQMGSCRQTRCTTYEKTKGKDEANIGKTVEEVRKDADYSRRRSQNGGVTQQTEEGQVLRRPSVDK